MKSTRSKEAVTQVVFECRAATMPATRSISSRIRPPKTLPEKFASVGSICRTVEERDAVTVEDAGFGTSSAPRMTGRPTGGVAKAVSPRSPRSSLGEDERSGTERLVAHRNEAGGESASLKLDRPGEAESVAKEPSFDEPHPPSRRGRWVEVEDHEPAARGKDPRSFSEGVVRP